MKQFDRFTWECERQADFEESLKMNCENVCSVPPEPQTGSAIQGPSHTQDSGQIAPHPYPAADTGGQHGDT